MDRLVELPTAPLDYPRDLERAALLKDGTPVFLRPVRPEDAPRLIETYSRFSKQTAYQRFFTLRRRLPPDWARHFASVDYQGRLALIVERETVDEPELIGVARYESDPGHVRPEVALVVQDGWQGRGLGTLLLTEILRAGESRGFRGFRALVLADNTHMLDLLSRYTDITQRTIEDEIVCLTFERRRSVPHVSLTTTDHGGVPGVGERDGGPDGLGGRSTPSGVSGHGERSAP